MTEVLQPTTIDAVHSEIVEYHEQRLRPFGQTETTPSQTHKYIDDFRLAEMLAIFNITGLAKNITDKIGHDLFVLRHPDYAFINTADSDFRSRDKKSIELGFTSFGANVDDIYYENERAGIKLCLDGKPGLVEIYTASDDPNLIEERHYEGEVQLNLEQLRAILQILHKFAPLKET